MRLDKGQIEVVDDRVAEILKTKTGPERLRMVWDAWTNFRQRLEAHLKHQYSEWSQEQIQNEIIRRVSHGTEIAMGRALGPVADMGGGAQADQGGLSASVQQRESSGDKGREAHA